MSSDTPPLRPCPAALSGTCPGLSRPDGTAALSSRRPRALASAQWPVSAPYSPKLACRAK